MKAAVEKASADFRARGSEGAGRRSLSLSRDPSMSLHPGQQRDGEGPQGGCGDGAASAAEGGLRQRRLWSDGGDAKAEGDGDGGDAARAGSEDDQEDFSS